MYCTLTKIPFSVSVVPPQISLTTTQTRHTFHCAWFPRLHLPRRAEDWNASPVDAPHGVVAADAVPRPHARVLRKQVLGILLWRWRRQIQTPQALRGGKRCEDKAQSKELTFGGFGSPCVLESLPLPLRFFFLGIFRSRSELYGISQ